VARWAECILFVVFLVSGIAHLGCAGDDDPKTPQLAEADATNEADSGTDQLTDAVVEEEQDGGPLTISISPPPSRL